MSLPVTFLSAAVLGLLIVLLAARVSQLRMRYGASLGDHGHKDLGRFIRIHANTVEWTPIFLLLCLLTELGTGTSMALSLAAGAFVLARLIYAAGMWNRGFSPARQIGALVSYLAVAGLSVTLLIRAVS